MIPGPVSDCYHPEWGTTTNCEDINNALNEMHKALGEIIKAPPKYILEVVQGENDGPRFQAEFTEREWRILRFACERAAESL